MSISIGLFPILDILCLGIFAFYIKKILIDAEDNKEVMRFAFLATLFILLSSLARDEARIRLKDFRQEIKVQEQIQEKERQETEKRRKRYNPDK